MDILNRDWHRADGASPESIVRLRSIVPAALPESYFTLLSVTNGGEGPLARQPLYFQLDPVEVVADTIASARHDEFFPGFLVIGSNGGGEFVVFDLRKSKPWPVVAIDMTNADLTESVMLIAPDFDSFLKLVGVEHED